MPDSIVTDFFMGTGDTLVSDLGYISGIAITVFACILAFKSAYRLFKIMRY